MSKIADNVVVITENLIIHNVVEITEDLTISNVDRIRDNLVEALNKSAKLEVVLSFINTIDISGLQLLISLYNEALFYNKEIEFSGDLNVSFIFEMNKMAFPSNTITNAEDLQNFINEVL